MKNYYKILGISSNTSEKKLYKIIDTKISELKANKNYSTSLEMMKKTSAISNLEDFKKAIEQYGSKENFDKALMLSNKSNNVNVNKDNLKVYKNKPKINWKKVVLLTLGATFVIGISKVASDNIEKNTKKVEIPIYPGESVNDILEEYDISKLELKGEKNSKLEVYSDMDAKSADLYVNVYNDEKEVNRLNGINDKRVEEHNQNEFKYTFRYVVVFGNTLSGLREQFSPCIINHDNNIYAGEEITVYTSNKALADEMNAYYKENYEDEIFEVKYYTISEGDTIVSVANKLGVSPQRVVDSNSNILEDVNSTIYAGQTIKINIYTRDMQNNKVK